VRPFPGPGAKLQISTNGGTKPIWSRDGRELFYINGDKMMAVDVSAQLTLTPGPPHLWLRLEQLDGKKSFFA
jgi:hypothetical protein